MNVTAYRQGFASHAAAHGGHMLCVSKDATPFVGKEMVVTPEEERHTAVAACGVADGPTAATAGANAASLVSSAKAKFDAKTRDSWIPGHRSGFAYWTRGVRSVFGKPSLDPYYASVAPSSATDAQVYASMGFGACWQALRYNLYAFPIPQASSFAAKLRVYDASFVTCGWPDGYDYSTAFERRYQAYNFAVGNCAALRFNVSAELNAPSSYDTTGNSGAEINLVGMANNGLSGADVPAVNVGEYDFCNIDNVADARRAAFLLEAYATLPVYLSRGTSAAAPQPYSFDFSLSDTIVGRIKSILASGRGDFWLVIGPPVRNGWDDGAHWATPGVNTVVYFSRCELILTVSMSGFNL